MSFSAPTNDYRQSTVVDAIFAAPSFDDEFHTLYRSSQEAQILACKVLLD
jgi:hypothetical protein